MEKKIEESSQDKEEEERKGEKGGKGHNLHLQFVLLFFLFSALFLSPFFVWLSGFSTDSEQFTRSF